MPENTPTPTYYADLNVSPSATQDQIKSAFHHLAKLHHPDKKGPEHDGDTSEFRKAREAYEVLSNPGAKAAYDRGRAWETRCGARQYTPPAETDGGGEDGQDETRPEPKFSMSDFWASINPPGGFKRTGTGKYASSNYRPAVPP
jgi:DnaJ-class molecular chaperone